MEKWDVAICKRCKDADYYLLNRTRTAIKFTTKVPFNMGEFLSALEDVQFPFAYTEGLEQIIFRRMRNYYGLYGNGVMEIGAKPRRTMRMYIETFIHEVAHHVDVDEMFSEKLHEERRRRGRHIGHVSAANENCEYWARGFERFYSLDKGDRKKLRKKNPRLYRTILRLHRKFRKKR